MTIYDFARAFIGSRTDIQVTGRDTETQKPFETWRGTNHDIYHLPEDHLFRKQHVWKARIRNNVLEIMTR